MTKTTKTIEITKYITTDGIEFDREIDAKKHEWEAFIAKKVYIIINIETDTTKYLRSRYIDIFSSFELGEKARIEYSEQEDYYTEEIFLNERFWEEEWNQWHINGHKPTDESKQNIKNGVIT